MVVYTGVSVSGFRVRVYSLGADAYTHAFRCGFHMFQIQLVQGLEYRCTATPVPRNLESLCLFGIAFGAMPCAELSGPF